MSTMPKQLSFFSLQNGLHPQESREGLLDGSEEEFAGAYDAIKRQFQRIAEAATHSVVASVYSDSLARSSVPQGRQGRPPPPHSGSQGVTSDISRATAVSDDSNTDGVWYDLSTSAPQHR